MTDPERPERPERPVEPPVEPEKPPVVEPADPPVKPEEPEATVTLGYYRHGNLVTQTFDTRDEALVFAEELRESAEGMPHILIQGDNLTDEDGVGAEIKKRWERLFPDKARERRDRREREKQERERKQRERDEWEARQPAWMVDRVSQLTFLVSEDERRHGIVINGVTLPVKIDVAEVEQGSLEVFGSRYELPVDLRQNGPARLKLEIVLDGDCALTRQIVSYEE